jgi:CrcB protein
VNLLVIAIGGAIGSVARYLLSTFLLHVTGSLFPVGTFVVNVIGCFAFGAIAGAASQRVSIAPEVRLFLFVGVLGGFTTFSSYAFENVSLVRDGQLFAASVNTVGQVVVGMAALWAGYALVRSLTA